MGGILSQGLMNLPVEPLAIIGLSERSRSRATCRRSELLSFPYELAIENNIGRWDLIQGITRNLSPRGDIGRAECFGRRSLPRRYSTQSLADRGTDRVNDRHFGRQGGPS